MVLSFSFRLPHLGIALVAGVTAALAFLAAGEGGILSFLLANFSPLPLMIASLGWSLGTGIAASLFAGVTIILAADIQNALAFLALIALPGVGLTALAMRRSGKGYTSMGRLLEWIGWAAIFSTMAEIALWAATSGGYEVASSKLAHEFAAPLSEISRAGINLPDEVRIEDVALFFARAVPFFSVAMTVILLTMNIWLAARAVQISGRLERPFPSLPEATLVPRELVVIFVISCLATGIGLILHSLSLTLATGLVAAGLLTVFALQGLALLHAATRAMPLRGLLLTFIYFGIVVLSLWPLVIAALAGFVECLVSKRRIVSVTENSNKPQE